jgi:hypothetical protein
MIVETEVARRSIASFSSHLYRPPRFDGCPVFRAAADLSG